MEEKKHSAQFLRKRRFLMVLPLMALPFIIIIFVALGGGKGINATAQATSNPGINLKLPDAHFNKAKEKDKLALYELAGKDSSKLYAQMKADPYYKLRFHNEDSFQNNNAQLQTIFQHSATKYNQPNFSMLNTTTGNTDADAGEQKITQKLAQLKMALHKKQTASDDDLNNRNFSSNSSTEKPEITGIEHMMHMIQSKGTEHDQDLDQLNGMLDKIIMVQHPEKLQDSMRQLSEKNKTKTYIVSNMPRESNITVMGNSNEKGSTNGFFGLEDDAGTTIKQNAIEAAIHETQTLVSGATVRLRLLNDILVGGIRIPKDEFIYGVASLNNERLKISINSVGYKNNILPVSLEVYDLDGMAGIYIPGSINRDVSKQSANDALGSIGLTTLDPSLGAQAASAGIQAAKTLMTKKLKLVRVTLKEGYKVLLKDNNQK
jgi:conjugative transposon TraM protein